MNLSKGQYVRHPKIPDWGLGRVLEVIPEETVWVDFEMVGEKKLDLRYVSLQVVPDSEGESLRNRRSDPVAPLTVIDMDKVRSHCDHFIVEMKDNRTGFNDAGVAEEVLADLSRLGRLRPATYRKLAAWCHTDGPAFQRGISIAQDISVSIFGRVIERE